MIPHYAAQISKHSLPNPPQQAIETGKAKLTPLRLDAKENPNPPSQHLQALHKKNAPLQIIKMVQMRTKLKTPSTAQHRIDGNRRIIKLLGVEISMSPQAPGVLRVLAFLLGGEEREIPIASYIPVKRVSGIEEDGGEPEPEERGFGHAVFGGFGRALQRAEDDDREGGRVFERVGEVHAAPACGRADLAAALVRVVHAKVLD